MIGRLRQLGRVIARFRVWSRRLPARPPPASAERPLHAVLGEARDLADAILPHADDELPRDLLVLLACIRHLDAGPDRPSDPYRMLRSVRDLAWSGYAAPSGLARTARRVLGDAELGRRTLALANELAAKRCGYMFLIVVAAIDRHQAAPAPARLLVDDLFAAGRPESAACRVRFVFRGTGPHGRRAASVLNLAVVSARPRPPARPGPPELAAVAARQLRLLYEEPDRALADLSAGPNAPDAAFVARARAAASELERVAGRALWLDALIIAETWLAGPQRLERAFSLTARSYADPDG